MHIKANTHTHTSFMKWIINLNEFHEMKIRDDCWSSANRKQRNQCRSEYYFSHVILHASQQGEKRKQNKKKTRTNNNNHRAAVFFFVRIENRKLHGTYIYK